MLLLCFEEHGDAIADSGAVVGTVPFRLCIAAGSFRGIFRGGRRQHVITGKSTTDHAISMVVQQDCALLRVVRGRPICDPDDEVLIELVGFDSAEENSADEGDFDLQDNGTTTFREPAREVAIVKSPRQQSVKLNRVTEINASNTSYGKKVGDLISTMGISDG